MKSVKDISPEEFEEIEAYLNGELSGPAAADFREKMQADPNRAAKVHEVKLLITGIREADLLEKMEQFHQPLSAQAEDDVNKDTRPSFTWKKLGIAASVLAVVALGFWWMTRNNNTTENLFAAYYKQDPGLITSMAPGRHYEFEKAMVDYKNGEYNKAIGAWESLYQTDADNDTLSYFLGVAHLGAGHTDTAIAYLQQNTQKETNTFFPEACWYLGLALVKKEELALAADYIRKSGNDRRDELLTELNKN